MDDAEGLLPEVMPKTYELLELFGRIAWYGSAAGLVRAELAAADPPWFNRTMVVEPIWKIWKRTPVQRELPVTAAWIADVSVERYRPMLRLLDNSDLKFLSSQPGFGPQVAVRLRRQRHRIFAGYLSSLHADFRQTCAALRSLMIHAREDRPDLGTLLVRKQLAFGLYMLRARWSLALYRCGIGSVDAGCLMNLFDSVCLELHELVPVGHNQC